MATVKIHQGKRFVLLSGERSEFQSREEVGHCLTEEMIPSNEHTEG